MTFCLSIDSIMQSSNFSSTNTMFEHHVHPYERVQAEFWRQKDRSIDARRTFIRGGLQHTQGKHLASHSLFDYASSRVSPPAACYPISCSYNALLFYCYTHMALLNAIQLTLIYDRSSRQHDSYMQRIRHAALQMVTRFEGVRACYVSKQLMNQELWIFVGE